MKIIILAILFQCTLLAYGQVYDFREVTTVQVREMNMDNTVVIIPGGLMEEHGPYLPLYTDGYTNEALARRIADSIYTATNFKVLIFPTIPLGVGSPESFAGIKSYPGVVYLKPSTFRSVFMDIGDMLGGQGVKWIFIVFKHGSQQHNQALIQACDYFNDSYPGQMVPLSALVYDTFKGPMPALSSQEQQENGIDIHAGMDETSRMLYNRPDLVRPAYKTAIPFTAKSWADFTTIAKSKEWQGYYGSPRLATKEFGEQIMNKFAHNLSELAIKIIQGYDCRNLPKLGSQADASSIEVEKLAAELDQKQKSWLIKNKLK